MSQNATSKRSIMSKGLTMPHKPKAKDAKGPQTSGGRVADTPKGEIRTRTPR